MKSGTKIAILLLAGLLAALGFARLHAKKSRKVPARQEIVSTRPDANQTPALTQRPGAGTSATTMFPLLEKIKNSSLSLDQRYSAVAALAEEDLNEARVNALLEYIKSPLYWDQAGADQARSLRNNILNILRDSKIAADPIIAALSELARDRFQDPGLRDYALQHMTEWMPQITAGARSQVEGALRASLAWEEETYAGTGLIGLSHLMDQKMLSSDFAVSGAVKQILLSGDYSYESRMTAMAVAGERNVKDADLVKLATKWADDEKILVGARRAAQTYLKRLGANPG